MVLHTAGAGMQLAVAVRSSRGGLTLGKAGVGRCVQGGELLLFPQSKEKGTVVGKNGRMKGRACSPALHTGIQQPAKQAWKSPVVGREAEMREAGLQKACGWQRPKIASRVGACRRSLPSRQVVGGIGWLARPKSKIEKE